MKNKFISFLLLSLFLMIGALKMVSAMHAGFIEQTPITSSLNHPVGLFVGDIDNDSHQDVVSTSSLNKTINWYKNNGDNTFSLMVDVATLTNAVSSITGAYINNDNYLDIIATSFEGNTVSWYLNNGNGTFTPQTVISSTADGAISVATSDLNNDGLTDIISGNQSGNSITWYMNNGDNTFVEQIPVSITAGAVNKIVATDFNMDGFIDILSSDTSNNLISVYQNNGDSTFTLLTTGLNATGTMAFDVTDVNHDSFPDIVSANNGDNTLVWYQNNGGLSLEPAVIIDTVPSITNAIFGDFDDDDNIDIATIASINNTISLYLNNGDGTFAFDSNISTTIEDPKDFFVADLNNNGSLDLIVTTYLTNGIKYLSNQETYDFNLTFVDYDGSVLETYPLDYGTSLTEIPYPADPYREGYTFSSWNKQIPEIMPYFDLVITAEYTINQYILEFHDFDGTVLSSETFEYNTDLSLVSLPVLEEREGFVFSSWDLDIPSSMPSFDLIITALYDPNFYHIDFYNYNGELLQTGYYEYLSDITDVIPPSVPARTGYLFSGWDVALPEVMTLGDIVLTATYTEIQYLVEYQDYDGVVLQTQTFPYLSDLTVVNQPVDPFREGFEFIGWNIPLPSLMGANDIILIAVYKDIQAPVISGLSNIYYNQSEANEFVVPEGIVEDNVDLFLQLHVSFFQADGVTPISDLNRVREEIALVHNIVIKYNATDTAGNIATQVVIIVRVRDDIPPTISGVENNQVLDRNSEVTITFSDGTGKLNGRDFESGSTISISNTYRLVVTDEAGNSTVVNFEIQDFSTGLVIIMTGSLLLILISGIIFIRVRGIF